jgi:3-methyladenine DNA glycosylase AlkD
MAQLKSIKSELFKKSNPKRAKINQWFFKTEKGQYGEGDIFIGVTMPEIRKIVSSLYKTTTEKEINSLIYSEIHEERMAGLLVILNKYQTSKKKSEKRNIISYLLKNREQINNWDLVDVVIPKTLGNFLLDKDRKTIYKLAKSKSMWDRRISVLTCFAFIKNNELEDAIKIAKIHLKDKEYLMHKAVGWMLREVGKKDEKQLIKFLKNNYNNLPRTTLRYAIEKFPEKKRKEILKGKF